jgi:thiol-disulfide isomerase/thioredoxin
MNQRLSNRYNTSATAIRYPFSLAFVLAVVVGCGRSEPNDSPVVDPPAPVAPANGSSTKSGSNGSEMSGGLELPEGAIPTPDAGPSPSSSSEKGGGIQMPDATDPKQPSDVEGASTGTSDILYASWQQIQAAAEMSGKVTVVDLWSLSCAPCLKEFPGLVRLHNEMGNSVQCIAVDMDYDGRRTRPPEHYADRVGAFLTNVGASGFPTYISNTPSDDVFAAMKIASLPAVLVYEADGSVAKLFVDAGETAGFTYEKDIVPLVNDLASK